MACDLPLLVCVNYRKKYKNQIFLQQVRWDGTKAPTWLWNFKDHWWTFWTNLEWIDGWLKVLQRFLIPCVSAPRKGIYNVSNYFSNLYMINRWRRILLYVKQCKYSKHVISSLQWIYVYMDNFTVQKFYILN